MGDAPTIPRPVVPFVSLLLGTVAVGLATRRFPSAFPAVVATYGGDTLWAAMVFWLLALVRRQAATSQLAILSLAVAVSVEVSQRYHAPWIDAVRATRLGALALGQGFLWSDLACYVVGVGLAAGLDHALSLRRSAAKRPSAAPTPP